MIFIICAVLMIATLVVELYCLSRLKKKMIDPKTSEKQANDLYKDTKIMKTSIILSSVIMVLVCVINSFYIQNTGVSSVVVSFSGKVQGVEAGTGIKLKLPWTNVTSYDTRNNVLSFIGSAETNDNYTGGNTSSPQITFQDANGVTGNIDLNLRYSIKGESVREIYEAFKTQEEFVKAVLLPEVRSRVRETIARYDTTAVYGSRDQLTRALEIQLSQAWTQYGVEVEALSLQEVRYPDEVVASFSKAQSAKAEVEQARAEQEKAKVEAETNKIKSSQLTDAILKEKLIDAIKTGNGTYIIDTDKISIGVK